MILQNIIVKNFGVFRGTHEFNLEPDLDNRRPIILFGGLNGSGKTTLFEGIKLCLYGQPTFQEYKTKKLYHDYISKRIMPLDAKNDKRYYGAIELNLEFNDFGVKDRYSVRRKWKVENGIVDETFRVLKNNQMIDIIEQEHSQSFIANIIPMGISNLFFFDGEKIQDLAQDTVKNGFFKEALDSILGLDVIETLERDLKTYAYKENANTDDSELIVLMDKHKYELYKIERNIRNKTQEQAGLKTKLEKSIEIIQRKENELTLQGAGYAKKRFEFQERLSKTEKKLEDTRNQLKTYYSGLFPFTLVSGLSEQLQKKIEHENKRKNEKLTMDMIEAKKDSISKELLNSKELKRIKSNQKEQQEFIDSLLRTITNTLKESNNGEYHFINDFSEKDLNQLLFWVDQTRNVIPSEIETHSKRYEEYHVERAYYENLLRKVPDDSILDPIVKEINVQYTAKGGYDAQMDNIGQEMSDLKLQRTEITRLLDLQLEKYEQQNKNHRKIALLKNIRQMLDEYKDAIRDNKMEMLRTTFLDAISMIIRKHDFINDIEIESDYNIRLQRGDGNYIYKSMLSNGEKQIFAVSMLLALARVSGKPLPFIIDTPLARLDSAHRDNIVENFFPNASHQVIIFSTDTEIDKMYFEKLSPHITRVYHLEWSTEAESSNATEGYFWESTGVTQD